ncbi:unnamed protein product [Brassicogethes aeneus]|uniref:Translation initiation factor eIF2B subunit epsilon n=1 Tax=Brassicogethes aeneus TaxID=1431903 RepID=A0A9P0BC18_BRAAE|nr:unnamed protein product [Brassicogethes aeneus]
MSNKSKELVQKENAVQAIIVVDTFDDEFLPLSNDIPHALLPLVNKPIIDYTLEFLSLGGIEETFLFCCTHIDAIKQHINKCVENAEEWTQTMKVNVVVSESCRSFGDCLRDLDAKGYLRGDFVLVEPGTISNINLLPLLEKHNKITKIDKGAAMTLIFQESGLGHISRCPKEEVLMATNSSGRVLFHKKLGTTRERKIEFPLEIFLENSTVSLRHNLKDTHISICSPAVLPLFSDNFDFQTRDDFVRGLLMNEEILGMTVYSNVLKGGQFGGAVTNWRTYQTLSHELKNNYVYPVQPSQKHNSFLKNDVIAGQNATISKSAKLNNVIMGDNVKIGENVDISNSFIFSNTKVEDNVTISLSIVGPNCLVKEKSKILAGTVLGKGVQIEKECFVEDALVQSTRPDELDSRDVLGKHAFRLVLDDNEPEDVVDLALARKLSRLHIDQNLGEESEDDGFSESEDERSSYTHSPAPDDTKLFFTEVIDSLTRGFEDKLQCDNLILEINSSRYAYNVTVKEVNFFVIKAILIMSLRQPMGPQYFSQLQRLLQYFVPILKNYLRNESAMLDCLQAVEDVATSNENLTEKWVMFVLQYFYDKDHVTEDAILKWYSTLDKKSNFHAQVKPFTDWLQEAEEASSSEDE